MLVSELKRDALWRAGEPAELDGAGASTSDYDSRALDYLNAVQSGLLLGSPLGVLDERGMPLPAVDWWWARKSPHGTIYVTTEIAAGTVAVTQGSATATFDVNLSENVDGWRLRVTNHQTVPRIVSTAVVGGVTVATMDDLWPESTETAAAYTVFPLEFALPADFLRFAGPLIIPGQPWRCDVVDESAMDDVYPLHAIVAGTPTAAAMIGSQRVRFNRYRSTATGPLRVEFPYIYKPADMTLGGTPILPAHHHRLLSIGAAYYICLDKSDSKAGDLKAEFRGFWAAMLQEHMRHAKRMSRNFGRLQYRLDQLGRRRLISESGLVIDGGAEGYGSSYGDSYGA